MLATKLSVSRKASMASGIGANPIGIIQGISVFLQRKDALSCLSHFFSLQRTIFLILERNKKSLENIEELQSAKDSLGV